MKTENGKIEGDYIVDDVVVMNGMVTGTIRIDPNATLTLHGICCGDLIVAKGGTAAVHGAVSGDIVNEGILHLEGTVNGNVRSKHGTLQRFPKAVVHGEVES
jgi:cytoskeletal protein CcmA (bactofilin family)